MNSTDLFKDNLRDTHWLGIVVNNQDPLNQGRCKVRVYGKFDNIEPDFIPWANPMNRISGGTHIVPNVGEVVGIRFNNGNLYHPEYEYNVKPSADFKSEVLDASGQPQNVVSLIYDTKRNIRVYYSPEDGLVISTANTKTGKPMIRLTDDGKIFINADDVFIASTSTDESEPAVKGKTLEDILQNLITEVRNHVHPANMSPMMPTSITKLAALQKKVKTIKQTKKP